MFLLFFLEVKFDFPLYFLTRITKASTNQRKIRPPAQILLEDLKI